MKALCWNGFGQTTVETVEDPYIRNPGDAIIEVSMSCISGSDVHVVEGRFAEPKFRDILGREFTGRVVEAGPKVEKLKRGDRVVVSPVVGCGDCVYCSSGLWALCDNSNPHAAHQEKIFGAATAGIIGHPQRFGGYAGGHAQYVRVPFADHGAFVIPDELEDDQVILASDSFPAAFSAAEMADIRPGDTVSVWGCGAVGLLVMKVALHLGAARVIGIDRHPARLTAAQEFAGAEVMDYSKVDIQKALKEMTGGRGPDRCIDAVGIQTRSARMSNALDKIKRKINLESHHSQVLHDAILACRKGGTVSIVGVYVGLVRQFPMGAAMSKGLTVRAGFCHSQKYIPDLIGHIKEKRFDPSVLITRKMLLDEGPEAMNLFKSNKNECLRIVLTPNHL